MAASEFSNIRERRSMLALASHDLRNPISALKLLLGAANEELQSAEGRSSQRTLTSRLRSMMRQTHELTWLVDCLANISFLEQDLVEVPVESVNLTELASVTIRRLAEAARLVDCKVVLQSAVVVSGRWRRTLLESVVSHIIESAVKSAGGKSIAVRVGHDERSAWLLSENHGVSPVKGEASACFERDFLLWTAREIAHALGASLVVDGQPGQTAALVLRLQ